MSAQQPHRAASIFRGSLHMLGAVFGGYAITALAVATLGAVLAHVGMARSEAVVLAAMLGFVVYLAVLLWAFAVKSTRRLWLVLAIGAAVLALVLRLLV